MINTYYKYVHGIYTGHLLKCQPIMNGHFLHVYVILHQERLTL